LNKERTRRNSTTRKNGSRVSIAELSNKGPSS
jgi:hypothetical protein